MMLNGIRLTKVNGLSYLRNKNPAHNSKAICNKGLISNSCILPCLNFGVGRQESSPQSLTAYSRKRYAQVEKRQRHSKLTMKMEI